MLALLSGLALAAAAPAGPAPDPHAQCAGLARRLEVGAFAGVETAPVAASAALPAHCRVTGTIRPTIRFEMRLPLEGWNGKFYQAGCGGFCGRLLPDAPGYSNGIVAPVARGYAAILTDSGHQGKSIGDATWALDNPQGVELYAHRWIPLTYAAGLSIIRAFYGREPARRYFSGCSNGGRAALVAAQRYPRLFHGIIAGCPVLDLTSAGGVFGAWTLKTNARAGGRVLDEAFVAKIPFLAAQVRAQCDAQDGRKDGLIADPAACRIDFARIPACPDPAAVGAAGQACLTPAEKRVAAQWYDGPRDGKGRRLFGGMPPGSEVFWPVWYLQDASKAVGTQLGDGFVRYLAFAKGDPAASAAAFDFDRDPARLAPRKALLNATDPNLSAYRDAGGKLLLWHGLSDSLVIPYQSRAYYRSVLRQMGGARRVQAFFRYFEAPGLGHCWEAPSPDAPEDFDPLTALEDWVEKGIAPDEIVARPSARQPGLAIGALVYRPYPLPPRFEARP